jgi:hypothetical protein
LWFHVKQAGADAKFIQHEPLGVAYHRWYPISIYIQYQYLPSCKDYSINHGARTKLIFLMFWLKIISIVGFQKSKEKKK